MSLLPLLLGVSLLAGARAQQLTSPGFIDAANDFAQEIVSHGGLPGGVAVSFESSSSLPPGDQRVVNEVILGRLRGLGVRLVKADSAAAEIQITFSEDWQGPVWVASIKQNGAGRLVIKKFPRPQKAAATQLPTVTVQKSVVWSQEGPVLDFLQDGKTLLVLEPEQISVYVTDSGKWKATATLGIVHEFPWPRDLRGHLQGNAHQITAFLPGLLCTGAASPPQLLCHASDDPWQLDRGALAAFYSPARNFFTGVLAGQNAGASVPAFFSAAAWQSGDTRQLLFAGNDGRTHLYQGSLTSPVATFNDWGSDVAAVHSGCGAGWQLLVASPANSSHIDSIQAMEIINREAVPVSAAVELNGTVRALWPGSDSQKAIGITESPATGKYEAFALSVSCNQ
ncbi:MAG TPA: hypothetical protein VN176_08395 [Verrucomicrobiae bacterium]|jgi:hypothetical protein|nr:hypothetical protein [Verrucomicrobiae bacterium]